MGPTRPKSGAAHTAQVEEVEPTLLMARVSLIQISSTTLADGEVNAPAAAGAEEADVAVLAGAAPRRGVGGTRNTARWRAGAALSRGGAAAGAARVHLEEVRAFTQLDGDGLSDDALRYPDMGATNHMTGSCAVFSKHDGGVTDTVRFGNGSVVKIEGRGTVWFACKNSELKQLHGIYYIPRPDTNLISVEQMDEDDY